MATLDGQSVLGIAVHVQVVPNASANQVAEFFGLNGQTVLYGGTRGRALMVSGVLYGANLNDLGLAEQVLETFSDGRTHTLQDDRGRIWIYCVYHNEYQPSPDGPKPCDTLPAPVYSGWIMPYRLVIRALI